MQSFQDWLRDRHKRNFDLDHTIACLPRGPLRFRLRCQKLNAGWTLSRTTRPAIGERTIGTICKASDAFLGSSKDLITNLQRAQVHEETIEEIRPSWGISPPKAQAQNQRTSSSGRNLAADRHPWLVRNHPLASTSTSRAAMLLWLQENRFRQEESALCGSWAWM